MFEDCKIKPLNNFLFTERTAQQLMTLEYQLDPTSTGICITCTFLDSSTTNCMAVVHQRISQLSSRGLMNIESSHKFNRSGDIAYGCIEGVNLEQYQVGVVNGKMFLPSMEPNGLLNLGWVLDVILYCT